MKDIYRNPTIRSLASALAEPRRPRRSRPAPASTPALPAAAPASTPGSTCLCGTLQLLFFLGYAWVAALAAARAYGWISAGSGLAGIYLRSVLFGGAAFLVAVHRCRSWPSGC